MDGEREEMIQRRYELSSRKKEREMWEDHVKGTATVMIGRRVIKRKKGKKKIAPSNRNRAGDLSVICYSITAERDIQLHHRG